MKRKIIIIVSWVAVAACMGVIFFLSAQTGTESQQLSESFNLLLNLGLSVEFVRTCAHCLEFMGLGVLVFNAMSQTIRSLKPLTAFAITSAYAMSDEIHQIFVDGRAFQISDWLVDSLGAAIGIAVVWAAAVIFFKIKGRGLNDGRC